MLIEKDTKRSVEGYLSKGQYPGLVLLGDKGIGKRLIADYIAKELLSTDNLEVCPDYLLVEPSNGSINIGQLEELKKRSKYCAVTKEYKVYVIDDADCMNNYSQNSLLKILEDGNATNIFIFVANKPLLSTIHSRCDTIRVNRPTDDEVRAYFNEKGLDLDETILRIADNRIGIYNQLISNPDFVGDCKRIYNSFLNLINKRDLLNAFGLVKEKDKNSFYDSNPIENVILFINYIKELFKDVLYDYMGVPNGTDYTALKSHYSYYECINIINVIDNHISRMGIKGQYSKNDFFDLIRFMVCI